MQSEGWSALFQHIPPEQHGNLMLVTTAGIEMALQAVLRVEDEHLLIKARLAGTDLPRFLFIPFCQINYLGFQKGIKEPEVRAMFGVPPEVKVAVSPEIPTVESPTPDSEPLPEPETEAAAAAPEPPPPTPEPIPEPPAKSNKKPLSPQDKKAMLERLRARVAAGVPRTEAPHSHMGA